MLSKFRESLAFSAEPNVIFAQYGEIKRQIPLLYALLVLNGWAVSFTHMAYAPRWITVVIPVLLTIACGWRAICWLLAPPPEDIDILEARKQLVRTTIVGGVMGLAFLSWSILLDQYGGPLERGHVAVFIAVTVIGCIFCLVSLPQAALALTAAVTLPYLAYYLLRGNPVFFAMALNIALVSIVMIRVLLNSFAGFEKLVRSTEVLAQKQIEAERLSEENGLLANTDALTGLPNRRHFFSRLERQLAIARESGTRFAVGVLDLDRFKPINDSHGHVVGDRLLVQVGARLRQATSGAVMIARLGGDEFGVLVTRDADQACAIGRAICDALAVPFAIDDHRITLGGSAGFAVYPVAGETVDTLFDRSDYALYHVKSSSRGGCAMFSPDHETAIRSERAVEVALQAADLAAELHILFQPLLCTETGAVRAVEALGRWTSPIVGSIAPLRFITIAERLGFIDRITLTLFGKALADFASLPPAIGLSFNLSAHDIASPATIEALIVMIHAAGIDPRRITFELTETALLRDFDAAIRGIESLRRLGISIALDDFGTGYSSLGYLSRLPLDKVKVDRSFIADMDEASGRNIIAAILGLCRTLQLDCIVEGVETEAQLRLLQMLGYRTVQGHLFAEPMPAAELVAWIGRRDHRQVA